MSTLCYCEVAKLCISKRRKGYSVVNPSEPCGIRKVSASLLDKESGGDVCTDASWTLGDLWIQWTYVIDLDNRVFTVNGILHFKFENMPPLRASGSKLGFVDYLEGPEDSPEPEIPEEYLSSLELWSKLNLDVEKAQQEYSTLQPTVATLSQWNAPTWDTLSVSQHLSASLIKTLVYDYSEELALCYYNTTWMKLGVFCWNVANAAASSHLLCPPADALPQSDMTYVLDVDYPDKDRISSLNSTTHFYLQYGKTMRRFYWFRGCLITFCPRLDEPPAYITHKVVQMVQNLRKKDRSQGVGIIMSGWHLVAVTVDGSDVRHSPVLELHDGKELKDVLELHDGKELKDGTLLLTHLLSPTFTRSKAPWLAPLRPQPYDVPAVLPVEVLRQIIYFTDFDTYRHLPMVSHYFRSIYLAYPRIGNHTLLSHEGISPNSEPVFRVQSTSSMGSQLAILKRTKVSMPESIKALPLWKYRIKPYFIEPVLKAGLAGMFQCHQTGTGPFNPAPTVTEENKETQARAFLKPKIFSNLMSKKHPNMRVQALDGIWEMVGVGEELEAEGASPGGE
ncbi:hypothetical protein RSAG8_06167, partial [Rhizoctonia solani AG-8 WAC10335]